LLKGLIIDAGKKCKCILALDLGVSFGFLLYALLLLVTDCELSLLACVFLDLLDDLCLVEAQIVVDFTLTITGFGFKEGAQVISLEVFVFELDRLQKCF